MDAPTEWTYGGLVDWASEDTLRLASPQLILRPIIEALRERITVTGSSMPSIFDPYNPLRMPYDYINVIYIYIQALITSFVNHTDSSGNWSNITTMAPYWTLADMLTAIGDASYIVPSNFSDIKPFAIQCYKILNKLKWRQQGWSVNYTTQSKGGYGDDLSEAISEYNNAPWVSGTYYKAMAEIYRDSIDDYTIRRNRSVVELNTHSSEIGASVDSYIYTDKPDGELYEYNAQGENVIEDKYSLVQTDSESLDETITIYVPSSEGVPPNIPGESSLNYLFRVPFTGGAYSVLKFDGANGFQFKDW